MEQNFTRVWERQSVLRLGGVLVLQEVADLFIFLDQVQIKMLELPRRCLSAFIFIYFFSFLAVSDEERLEGEGENIKQA